MSVDLVLTELRRNVEYRETEVDGSEWGGVYLDNARPPGMSRHAFAGYLSALNSRGIYRPIGDDGTFGLVQLNP